MLFIFTQFCNYITYVHLKGKSLKQKEKMSENKKQYPKEMLEKAVEEVKAEARRTSQTTDCLDRAGGH